MATLIRAGSNRRRAPGRPTARGRVRRVAVGSAPGAARPRSSSSPAAVGLDALSDPDVWWHIRLGDWIIAHHQIPAGELFAYTAFGNPLVAHEWLSETIFAALAAVGGLFLVTVLMGLVAWSAMLATVLRGRPSRCRAGRARRRAGARARVWPSRCWERGRRSSPSR